MPLHCPKENQKEKENKINIKSEKLDKRKEKLSVSKAFHNTQITRKCHIRQKTLVCSRIDERVK